MAMKPLLSFTSANHSLSFVPDLTEEACQALAI